VPKRGYGLQKGGIVDIVRKYRGSVLRKGGTEGCGPEGGPRRGINGLVTF
jgi:hypothetical protein